MAIDSQALRNRAQGLLSGFSAGQRAVIIVATVMLVIGGVFFAQWAAKPTMVPLYSNLSSEDASEITSKLASSGVKYELSNGGNTILVPQKSVYQTRIDMAGQGLPAGGQQGYALLDKQGITTSEFREHVDYQRALEGELSKTIGAIDGVDAATVHLVIPKEDVFAEDDKKPSASVLVKTRPGKSLAGGQVQAIVNLTASSIEGLTTDSVTVADASGKVLAAPGQSGASNAQNEAQGQATTAVETDLNTKISNILTPVVGQGKALVSARAQLNFDKSQTTSEIFNPNNKPANASSERIDEETYTGGNPNATGVLGPDGVPLAEGASGSGDYSKRSTARDLQNDRTVTQTEKTPGSIDRLSVAVVLDSNVANIDATEIEQLVTEAAGLSVARGDTVKVSRLPFDQTQADAAKKELEEAAKAKKSESMMNIIKSAATVLIILAVLAILFVTTKRKAASYQPTPISLAELEAARTPALPSADDMMNAALEAGDKTPSADQIERAKVEKEITDLIERQPDEVAGLLRSWLADRRS